MALSLSANNVFVVCIRFQTRVTTSNFNCPLMAFQWKLYADGVRIHCRIYGADAYRQIARVPDAQMRRTN